MHLVCASGVDEARACGVDLPNEMECVVAALGKFGEGCGGGGGMQRPKHEAHRPGNLEEYCLGGQAQYRWWLLHFRHHCSLIGRPEA